MTDQSQSNESDERLLREFVRTGSQAAFRTLAERYAGLVFSVALRRTGQRPLAEEVAQNVFAVLARKAGALAAPDVKLAAWLHRASVLEAARAMRKESIRRRIMDDYIDQVDALSGWDAGDGQVMRPELDSALDALPARDRELLLARFFEDRSYHDLSRSTGRSEAALMQQQHRALEKLAGLLRRRGAEVTMAALVTGLSSSLTQAAPAGLAASLVVNAPAAAAAMGGSTLFLHSFEILMHTKSRLMLASALGLCLLGGTGAFWSGKSRAESRWEARLTADAASTATNLAATPAVGPPRSADPATQLSLAAKLEAAVAGWRAATVHQDRMRALEAVDALQPDEVPMALKFLESLKGDYGLHLALAKRIAGLWGAMEPEPSLKWLIGYLPREHRGDPIQAILTDWARREPRAALAWWQITVDSLDFPIAEDAFERLSGVIYHGWAIHDPASLIRTLPEIDAPGGIGHHDDPVLDATIMGLATAAVDPATRAATLEALATIPHEGTRAAVAATTAMLMNVSDAAAGRDFALSLTFSEPGRRAELLGTIAMTGVMMQQQEPAEAVTWLRTHTDDATARATVEGFIHEQGDDADADLTAALRAALESR